MLDSETKRRIDTARQILVGKVPDPKSQVEQITIALIYKFMDDMDAESEEFGGKRKFFAKDFARYGWAKLMRSGLGGHETLNLYAEAIERMPENPGIPPLFRDIFKNAYLPYRDPETLKMFLKVIDEFTYDHSVRLGDAFEYLLSVLGSQGDAGQFRTPRHIIDFMVEVVDPKKTETVLDPACGTAGFLISAYKHILKANADKKGHSALTPDEKGRLAQNFTGYDISPDMVRLSLVNLYLHGFPAPHIYEYDTLTSQDRWNEYADVVLANPPFMSPKGGIKPHNRFGVQSKRSEVLFVDYMAEHLTPNGRAAIIVPEGIIFQSQTAYKQLRKMLVENALVAVVSLPAGCFNPYSGVKTSILFLDKSLAKRTDKIAFFKVENDGFDLGAQRRPIAQNDLLAAVDFCKAWLQSIRSGQAASETPNALVVEKAIIAKSGEYNLSGERYREVIASSTSWPLVPLSSICEFRSGLWKGEKSPLRVVKILRNTNFTRDGRLNLDDVAEHPVEVKQLESRLLKYGDIILEKSGGGPTQPVGRVALFNVREGEYSYSNFTSRIRISASNANSEYVWRCLHRIYQTGQTERLQKQTSGIRNLDNPAYQQIQIPLPPLSVQKEIVEEIEGYQKIIDGARAIVVHYRPHIHIRPEWPMVELSDIAENDWGNTTLTKSAYVEDGPYLGVSAAGCDGRMKHAEHKVGTLVLSAIGANCGRMFFPKEDFTAIKNTITIKPHADAALPLLIFTMLEMSTFPRRGGGQPFIAKGDVLKHQIPLPPLAEQRAIVAEIEAEQALVNANRDLIARMEKKIQAVLARVWGEEPA